MVCSVPANAPCQIFTLFSTPPSLWNLETVNGSSQVVLSGQTFQPLIMRVTDGSMVDNPVMGVTVTFTTTLAQMTQGSGGQGGESASRQSGMPVILGTSQTQVMTTLNGLASIVPSAGNVGPCDVFVSVSAGATTDQFQFENLASIVAVGSSQQVPGAGSTMRRSGRGLRPALQNDQTMVFATPQGDLSTYQSDESANSEKDDQREEVDSVRLAVAPEIPKLKANDEVVTPAFEIKKRVIKNESEEKQERKSRPSIAAAAKYPVTDPTAVESLTPTSEVAARSRTTSRSPEQSARPVCNYFDLRHPAASYRPRTWPDLPLAITPRFD